MYLSIQRQAIIGCNHNLKTAPFYKIISFCHFSFLFELIGRRNRLEELPKDQTIYVSCQVGLRGYLASRILKNNGFHVMNVDGGWKTYSSVYGSNINQNIETKTNDLGETVIENISELNADTILDVSGLTCPMPIVKLKKGIDQLGSGQVLELHATDRGTLNDLPAWSNNAGHSILKTEQDEK